MKDKLKTTKKLNIFIINDNTKKKFAKVVYLHDITGNDLVMTHRIAKVLAKFILRSI